MHNHFQPPLPAYSRFKDKVDANFVGEASGGKVVQLLGIESESKGSLDARTKSLCVTEADDTSVVDLSFDERRGIKLCLASDFEDNTTMSRFRIIHSFSTGFNITADTMIIAGRESVKIVQSMKGD